MHRHHLIDIVVCGLLCLLIVSGSLLAISITILPFGFGQCSSLFVFYLCIVWSQSMVVHNFWDNVSAGHKQPLD